MNPITFNLRLKNFSDRFHFSLLVYVLHWLTIPFNCDVSYTVVGSDYVHSQTANSRAQIYYDRQRIV